MRALEFTVELHGDRVLQIPAELIAELPKTGRARIIILTSDGDSDVDWQSGAYEQFVRDDSPEDAVYDSCK